MKMITWFAALTAIALANGQAVFQQSAYPLRGFIQPLTFPALQNPNFQQQALQQQQLAAAQQLLVQQPAFQQQADQQQQQAAATAQQPGLLVATNLQQQQPSNSAQQAPAYAGPSAVVNNLRGDGTYAFGYQTPDGQMRAESAQADGTTRGSYTYRTPEGQLVTINYTAGRNGFQTSPGTQITSAAEPAPAPSAQTAISSPVAASNPSAVPATGTGPSGSTIVLYSAVPQVGYSSYYPFTGVAAQPATSAGEQQQPAQGATQQQQQTKAAASTLTAPVGFSYGSNPQAIQELQRLLLVK